MTTTPRVKKQQLVKSSQAFRTISEVASILDMPQHVLRFWETKFEEVKPLKRGGGRRYYRPDDIELLSVIRKLLYEDGYTIKGVQKLFREGDSKLIKKSPQEIRPLKRTKVLNESSSTSEPVIPPSQRNDLQDVLRELEGLRKKIK
tara:strand:+ start:139 stop:576 length:438 start_codon:yes stop_codon:yes gene_type:complete